MSNLNNANSTLVMLKSWTSKIPLILLVGLFIGHFIVIEKYAVDIPFVDEWFMLEGLSAGLSAQWLFAQHNEHRIVTTKLLIWALYQLNDWNLITHQLLNFILYGLLLIFIVWFAKKTVPPLPAWAMFGFLIFLLSPINFENHSWGFQSQIYFALLFFLAAVYFLFCEAQKPTSLLIGTAMAVLAMYSFAGGLVACLVLLAVFCLFKLMRAFSVADREARRRELIQLGLVLALKVGALALWFVDYHKVEYHPPLALPHTLLFWRYFLNMVSWGFGFEDIAARWGAVCLLIILVPVAGAIWKNWRRRQQLPSSAWAVFVVIFALLGALAAITMGRAGSNLLLVEGKRSGFAEFGMMLIPFTVLAWSIFLRDRPKLKAPLVAGLWLFCFLGFWNNWSWFDPYYSGRAQERMASLECVKRYYEQGGDAHCMAYLPQISISPQLELAKELNLSFYQDIQNAQRNR